MGEEEEEEREEHHSNLAYMEYEFMPAGASEPIRCCIRISITNTHQIIG
jgi:hypothetical protein